MRTYKGQTPDTWDDAARICADEMMANFFRYDLYPPHFDEDLYYLRRQFERRQEPTKEEWLTFGLSALDRALDHLEGGPKHILVEVESLLVKKQMDYGTGNILAFGGLGLIVRVSDKAARLENLRKRGKGPVVEDETVEDTLLDLVGYSILGMMLARGWFELPLRGDVVQ